MNSDKECDSPNDSSEKENEVKSAPSLYKMELSKSYFNTTMDCQTKNSSLISDIQQPPKEKVHEHNQSFNAWKSKNRFFNKSQNDNSNIDMVSNLGRSLEHNQYLIPKVSCNPNFTEDIACNIPHMVANQPHDAEISQRIPKTYQQFFEEGDMHQNFQHYNHHMFRYNGNRCIPVKSYSERHFHEEPVDIVCTPPSHVYHQKLPVFKKKSQQFSQENYPNRPLIYDSNCQSVNYTPPSKYVNSQMKRNMELGCENNIYQYNAPYLRRQQEHENTCNCTLNNTKLDKQYNKEKIKSNKQISDLYRIVYLQNQQLGLLQKQVQKLIELNLNNDKPHTNNQGDSGLNKKYVKGSSEKRTFNFSVIKENEHLEKKVSVGIMTSFVENNFKKLTTGKESKVHKSGKNVHGYDSESSSMNSSDKEDVSTNHQTSNERVDDANISINLNEVVVPVDEDNALSPQTSFNIEMQEYNSSSDTDSSDSESSSSDSDENSPKIGWTFYDKVVGKVNDMLKQSSDTEDVNSDEDVRNATLDQLRQLGVSFVEPESPITKRVTFNNHKKRTKLTSKQQLQCDSETSLHMNALANKYLKKEHIPLSASNGKDRVLHKINSQNNLSHATLRYLERYQLSPTGNEKNEEPGKQTSPKHAGKIKKDKKKKNDTLKLGIDNSRQNKCGKILDVTAIKKQPKLLPRNT